ncbi:hypothetical protein [Terrabacter sp. MAHUQ-38]|jgi:hypothetical protein|uniref:hypothetical protein n=1 Tax=unclassified Terrabacter TaxID=2630222 RepID=UPI00165D9206|nr:hypothetical protein [Terrabacter sp. MAHUQ-38]MBC9823494.1 hypothetical protein [Terrabacter sp. MAHUQ-38]
MPRTRWVPALAVAAVITTMPAACATVEPTVHEPQPAVTISDGEDESTPKTLTLTPDAVRRLELTTVVVDNPTSVPYSAVVYDKTGEPWVYASPRDRTFIRVPVTIERVEGETATLSDGPPAGTRIVTRAVIKLYGAENGVGGGH